jgi:myo-inositol-1(or 4)-monophosphatase
VHPLLNIAIRAARRAGEVIVRSLNRLESLTITSKGRNDFVSEVDRNAEQEIIGIIRRHYPDHAVLAEESGRSGDNDSVWIIDPLDGTTNFLHAMPHFAINIALQREGQIVAALTYNPANGDQFWAERGKGAFLNDKRIRVAARTRMDEAVFATGIPFMGHGQHGRFLKELHQISQRVAGVRRFGSAALDCAWVATGRFDGFWERDLSPWDMAAGILLVLEAGGVVTDADGGQDMLTKGSICAANSVLHPMLLERLQAAA